MTNTPLTVKYPISNMLWRYGIWIVCIGVIFGVQRLYIPLAVMLAAVTVLFMLYTAVRYKVITIQKDSVAMVRPALLFSAAENFIPAQSEFVFYPGKGSFYDDPYFKIVQDGKVKRRIRLPLNQLQQVETALKGMGVKVRSESRIGIGA